MGRTCGAWPPNEIKKKIPARKIAPHFLLAVVPMPALPLPYAVRILPPILPSISWLTTATSSDHAPKVDLSSNSWPGLQVALFNWGGGGGVVVVVVVGG